MPLNTSLEKVKHSLKRYLAIQVGETNHNVHLLLWHFLSEFAPVWIAWLLCRVFSFLSPYIVPCYFCHFCLIKRLTKIGFVQKPLIKNCFAIVTSLTWNNYKTEKRNYATKQSCQSNGSNRCASKWTYRLWLRLCTLPSNMRIIGFRGSTFLVFQLVELYGDVRCVCGFWLSSSWFFQDTEWPQRCLAGEFRHSSGPQRKRWEVSGFCRPFMTSWKTWFGNLKGGTRATRSFVHRQLWAMFW